MKARLARGLPWTKSLRSCSCLIRELLTTRYQAVSSVGCARFPVSRRRGRSWRRRPPQLQAKVAPDEAAIEAAQVWATVEDQEDVVEAMRLDAVDEMTEQLEGTGVGGVDATDDEKEDGDNERTGCGSTVPPPYAEISSSFGLLERAA